MAGILRILQCCCLDCVALSELCNATCWLYPTHNGSFLSWEPSGVNTPAIDCLLICFITPRVRGVNGSSNVP